MKEPLVSIITPAFNSSSFIEETIQSVIKQTYKNWELLITDDYSSDNTIKIVKYFQKNDSRIKLFQLTHNQGAGVARNYSIKMAEGRFISFCDSDDQWKSNKLEMQINFMMRNKLAFTYSSYDVISDSGKFKKSILAPKILTSKSIISFNYVGCLTAIYDCEMIGKQYFPKIRKRQDWVLWINILQIIKKTNGLVESLAIYRDRRNSISSNKIQLLNYNWRVYHDILDFNKFKSLLLMMNFMIHYAIKKIK